MPSQSDTQAAYYPVAYQQRGKILPAKCKENGNCQQVKKCDDRDVFPIDTGVGRSKPEDILH
jgi:hypothetical protein